MQGFEHHNHDLYGIQAGMEILGMPVRLRSSHHHQLADSFLHKNYTVQAEEAAASMFSGDGTLSLFNVKQSDPLEHSFVGFHLQQPPLGLRNSKYWRPAQDLLKEFCNLIDESSSAKRPSKRHEEEGKANNSWCQSMHLLELQKMRARLVSMLEEVDKTYATYTGQMRAVVQAFESVAGEGSARAYSALASKAMSRHFRCLRDGIATQIAAVKTAMGEKGVPAAPGATRGETPRLKLLDQCLRQRRAFQQGLLEPHPWRPQRGLPERAVSVFRAWLFEHFLHPYPNDADKLILARQTGLSRSQVSNWFINARVRLWKPMVEEMYMEETKEMDQQLSDQAATGQEDTDGDPNPNSCGLRYDHKSPPAQLFTDSESVLFSIIAGSHQRRILQAENYDSVGGGDDLGFSYSNGGGGNSSRRAGVSLTLGLQNHNGGSMSLSLLPNSHTTHAEDDQQVHFSILDGDAVNLPYRNLMGAQLLHDFAG